MLSISAYASEKEMRRIMVGLKLFPAVLAADYQLAEKKDKQGYLSLYILYEDNLKLAQGFAKRLTQIKQIKNLPVKVEVSTFDEFINSKTPSSVAVFLAEPSNSKTQKILDRAISSSILLFSPFKGDVEKGIRGRSENQHGPSAILLHQFLEPIVGGGSFEHPAPAVSGQIASKFSEGSSGRGGDCNENRIKDAAGNYGDNKSRGG